jgi:hypothetical protein
MPAMKRVRWIPCIFSFLLIAANISAKPAGSWNAVKRLNVGDYISVKAGWPFRTLCLFVRASDNELICSFIEHGPVRANPSRTSFQRAKVREVRLEHSDDANGAALGAIVGGTTATAAAINNPAARKFSGVIGGVMGFWIGDAAGRTFHVLHGRIVYKR